MISLNHYSSYEQHYLSHFTDKKAMAQICYPAYPNHMLLCTKITILNSVLISKAVFFITKLPCIMMFFRLIILYLNPIKSLVHVIQFELLYWYRSQFLGEIWKCLFLHISTNWKKKPYSTTTRCMNTFSGSWTLNF